MSPQLSKKDEAAFRRWLAQHATADERLLPYEEQLKAHIQWLLAVQNELREIPPEELPSC